MKEDLISKLEKELNYYRSRNRELKTEVSEAQNRTEETSERFEQTVEEMGELDDMIEALNRALEE